MSVETQASYGDAAAKPRPLDFRTAEATKRARSATIGKLLRLAALCAGAGAAYVLIATHGTLRLTFGGPVPCYIALTLLANLLVVCWRMRPEHRIDLAIALVFQRVLLVHGGLAFATLLFRSYYSTPIMITGAFASLVAGCALAIARQRAAQPRIGIAGPWHPVIGALPDECERIAHPRAVADDYDIILTTTAIGLSPEWAQALTHAALRGARVMHAATWLEERRGRVSLDHFEADQIPAGRQGSLRVAKRLLDIAVVLVSAPLVLPVLLVSMVAVRAGMGAPVMFVQNRVGYGGRVFRMYKLRTMRPCGAVEACATTIGDKRVTRLGSFLRRYRIDELPQLWNVLRGDMSIVGPRPEQPALAEEYARRLPAFAYRSLALPGITGWAQVRAGYAADVHETGTKLAFDLFYLKNMSLALDAQILLRTAWTLVSGGGAR